MGHSNNDELPPVMELATLATLLATHHNLQHPNENRKPEDLLPDAYRLFRETKFFIARQVVAEQFNKLANLHPPEKKYLWGEVLTAQTQATAGASLLRHFIVNGPSVQRIACRITNEGIFEDSAEKPPFFSHKDMANRPVGITTVSS
jgi:hypothetical protein